MCGDLVHQQQRSYAAHGAHQPRMSQHQAGEQRFLFARGAVLRRLALGAVPHEKIAGLRADQRTPGGRVAASGMREHRPIVFLDREGGLVEQHLFQIALKRDLRIWKSRGLVAAGFNQHSEASRGVEAGARHRDAERGDFLFGGGQPARIRAAFLQQSVAIAQGPLELCDASAMIGVDSERQPVQKATPLASRTHEKPIHRRRQPQHLNVVGEGPRGGDRRAIDAKASRRGFLRLGFVAVAELCSVLPGLNLDRHREAAWTVMPCANSNFGATQTAAGREHGQRF